MRLTKTVSPKKLAANRRNALRSTGPRTLCGKATVAFNAVKSGLFAKHVLIAAGDGKEDESEFNRLLSGLHEHFRPQGMLESLLVETIATCAWRRRRVLRCETGQIRKRLDSAICHEQYRVADEFSRLEGRILQKFVDSDAGDVTEPLSEYGPALRALQRNSCGLQHLIDLLASLRSRVAQKGNLDEDSKRFLVLNFASDTGGFLARMLKCCSLAQQAMQPASPAEPGPPARTGFVRGGVEEPKAPSLEECRKMMLLLIDREIEILAQRKKIADHQQDLAAATSLQALSLPSGPAAGVVLRYAASIDRELYRALHQLERVQRQRQGESLPPPVSVSVAADF